MQPPSLTFFCELDDRALVRLLDQDGVLADLAALGATVSVALHELSERRAGAIRSLQAAGVPLVAWLLLPAEQGYFFTLDNTELAWGRYQEWRRWSEEHELTWCGVGLDFEPALDEQRRLLERPVTTVLGALRRGLDRGRLNRGKAAHVRLAERIRSDGLRLETYQIPLVVEERSAGATWLQRLAGVVDLPAEPEVLMVYSSILLGPAALCSYAPGAAAQAVGSTGGGIDPFAPLTWDALARDLLLATRYVRRIYIHSLEGCVRQGMLPRIRDLDWSAPTPPPHPATPLVDALRAALRAALRRLPV